MTSNGHHHDASHCCGPGFASPEDAMAAPREKLLYTIGIYTGSKVDAPDYLATVDADPSSPTYSQVIHRLEMPNKGDELHHFGWNACSSCHGDASAERRFLVVPGFKSSRIHIVDTADPRAPKLHKVIEPEEVIAKTGLTAPHTIHCLGKEIIISMLGNAEGEGPGGFLTMDQDFNITGRWEKDLGAMKYGYDFWYQPRHNVMVSSEFGAPNAFFGGFKLEDVGKRYGSQIHFWDFEGRRVEKSYDLGTDGMIPLEVRFHHDPASTHGYVGVALSSNVWHWHKNGDGWQLDKVIQEEPVEIEGFPVPLPPLITDILISMDDRFMYFSNWLHGDLRQYDISDPANPKLTGQVWIGGMLGKAPEVNGHKVAGGPQMLQLSLDGKRLYCTTSLLSSWDAQFYPAVDELGSCMVQIDCDTENGGMSINRDFFVDFGKEPKGPARAHETRYPGGDCTSDIWL
ncbi:selenium-binding family protein [Geminicoccus flavidas]|uniref:selenium-binding family protein n=1 Tax=Geminicoccus flavidas TaxID=2506407 RepID=UPI001358F303|nr:selenium-binding family protein [Geminicoccus flavidas]